MGPPSAPASPSFDKRMRVPVSTPDGILTESDRSFSVRPAPRQLEQGFLITCPAPEQVGQVLSTVKNPCCARTLPIPEHVPHLLGSLPDAAPDPPHGSQDTAVGTLIVFCKLLYASSRVTRIL